MTVRPATSSAVQTYSRMSVTSLSVNLPSGHAHDLEVEVQVRRLDVEEAADAQHPAEVAGRDAAELAVVDPPEVGRALERDRAEPEPAERVEHDRLHALDHRVEIVVAGSAGFGSISPNITAQPAS